MNFELDDDQREILGAVASLLERHAGPTRAAALAQKIEYDHALDAALGEAGFDEAMDPESLDGALITTLIIEAIAGAAGVTSFAAHALVARAASGRALPGPVALGSGDAGTPIRFGAHARTLLWLDGDEARLTTLEAGDAEAVASNFGYPLGRVDRNVIERSESLGPQSGERLRSWWRIAIAAEAVGTMSAALDQTAAYLKDRKQFGRAIASFQAVQHRLAECAVRVEGSRLLVYEAAYQQAPEEASACAAAHALESSRLLFRETHQLSGAIGFTREHPLHAWSMRLQALGTELSGATGHRRALAAARWGVA
ncbi:MAG: acyl-CoA dehydrogenase [bacterium]|nr:acyl-CoA dehydrogenase [Deltaproteobacteria bacterium]MCP4903832.1 acyl-CoA dehydrogenase [bacterium]